jgi:hypothetical protein
MPLNKSAVTPTGIDPRTFQLTAQCRKPYATPDPFHVTIFKSFRGKSGPVTVLSLSVAGSNVIDTKQRLTLVVPAGRAGAAWELRVHKHFGLITYGNGLNSAYTL